MRRNNDETNILATWQEEPDIAFQWLNKPKDYKIHDGALIITTGPENDFFIDPITHESKANAPFLFREMSGDFVMTAVVQPDFSDMWNAVSLMVYMDSLHWMKHAFEKSDATGKSIVSLMTKGTSDDANGPILSELDKVWLKIVRVKSCYAMHWSGDGKTYHMARLAEMSGYDKIKIGVSAQCPAGEQALHQILHLSIEQSSVKDLRNANH